MVAKAFTEPGNHIDGDKSGSFEAPEINGFVATAPVEVVRAVLNAVTQGNPGKALTETLDVNGDGKLGVDEMQA